jgi:uncharacterized Zn-finger protein
MERTRKAAPSCAFRPPVVNAGIDYGAIAAIVPRSTISNPDESKAQPTMADQGVPHFQNEAGVPVIEVGAKEFMCIGARPPFDHPHIFCDMGDDHEIICEYCSTLYRHNPALGASESRPADCAWTDPQAA